MKSARIICSAAALSLLAACGGSSGGTPAATATTTSTKAAADAAVSTAGTAIMSGVGDGFTNAVPAQVITKAGTPYVGAINKTESCTGGGSFTATGTFNSVCTGSPAAAWACTDLEAAVSVAFADCAVTITMEGTTYNEVLNGTADSTGISGGTASGTGQTISAVSVSGGMTGTVRLTEGTGGGVAGTVDLAGTTFTVTDATTMSPACAGTCSVTVSGETAETCTVASTCDGCTL